MDVCRKDLTRLKWLSDSLHSCGSHHWLHIRCAYCPFIKESVLTMLGFTNIVRFGPGPNGMLRTLGQYMAGSAATFGYIWPLKYASNTDRTSQLLHGHRHNYSYGQLAHRYPSLRQHQQPAHNPFATVPEPEGCARREELGVESYGSDGD